MVLPFKDSSEAAEPRRAVFSVIKLPNNPSLVCGAASLGAGFFKMRVLGTQSGTFAYLTAHG
jgi:hypothetical protein